MRVRFSEFIVDTDTRELLRDSAPVHLSPKAFQLLELLVTARPRALSKDALYKQLWPNTFVVEANLSNLVGELRAAFDDDPRHPRFVRTVHGFGYAFLGAPQGPTALTEQSGGVLYQLVWADGRVTFGEGERVLGRDPALELCVDSSSVSRHHARLRIARGEAVLEGRRPKRLARSESSAGVRAPGHREGIGSRTSAVSLRVFDCRRRSRDR